MLTILIYISYAKVAQTSWPRAVVSIDPGIEVTEDEQRFLQWNFADGSTEVVIEPILQFCCRGYCWSIGTDQAD